MKNIINILICLVYSLTLCVSAQAEESEQASFYVDYDDGGDLVYCNGDTDAGKLNGLFAIDFVTTQAYNSMIANFIPVVSWKESSTRIYSYLKKLAPVYAISFNKFVNQMFNSSRQKEFVWSGYHSSMLPVEKFHLIHNLPSECYQETESGLKPHIVNAIIREGTRLKKIYRYNHHLVSRESSGLDVINYSYLMVHEWLRLFSNNPSTIREVNRILHTDEIELYETRNFQYLLENLGMYYRNNPKEQYRSLVLKYINGESVVEGFGAFNVYKENEPRWLEIINETDQVIEIKGVVLLANQTFLLETYHHNVGAYYSMDYKIIQENGLDIYTDFWIRNPEIDFSAL